MKKYLSILFAAATAAALLISCEKEGDKGGDKIDADDPATVQTENLVAYFPLESEAKAVELGEGISFSKKAGAAAFVKGVRGKCYANSAVDCKNFSYLDFALAANNPFKSMTSFTMSCWVKMPVPNDGSPAMISLNGGDGGMGNLLIMNEGWGCNTDSLYVKAYLYNSRTEWKGQDIGLSNAGFTTDKWFHLVYSYNESDSKMTLYSNGQFIADSGRWAGPADADGNQEQLGQLVLDPAMKNLYIGAWWNNLDGTHADAWRSSFPGMVDELRVWKVALTPEEVTDLYTKEVIKADAL
jgi:hypothetical protein